MSANRAVFPVAIMARVLGVSQAGYYSWLRRPPSAHARADELLDRRRFRSHAEARMAVFSFIEGFYHPVRLHSALGYRSPVRYEQEVLPSP